MLNKYESIYIINPNVEGEALKGLVEKFNALIESEGGKVTETNEWGMKKLAYPIKKFEQGYYVLVNFEAISLVTNPLITCGLNNSSAISLGIPH